MNRIALSILLLAAISPMSDAGVIEFDPPSATVVAGDVAVFSVTVASTGLADFDAIALLFSSDLTNLGLSFEYDENFETSVDPVEPISAGAFAADLLIGGNNFVGWQAPVLLGLLTVDTAGVTGGSFAGAVQVRPDAEAALLNRPFSTITLDPYTEELTGSLDLEITDGATGGGGTGGNNGGDTGGDTGTDGSDDTGTDSGGTDDGTMDGGSTGDGSTGDGGGDSVSDPGDPGTDGGGDGGTDGSGDDGGATDGSGDDPIEDPGDGNSGDDMAGGDDQDGTVTNDGTDTGGSSNDGSGNSNDGASDEGGNNNSAAGAFCGMGMINATFMTLLMLFTSRHLRIRRGR
ncbi:MAG: hypothetical protein ACYTHJ_17110 [Planctomycetota bacterium]|jgi:hypothetical protein